MQRQKRKSVEIITKPLIESLPEHQDILNTEQDSSNCSSNDTIPASAVNNRLNTDFPIVGIGASAGGLAAFEAFFSGMPAEAEPGMAFVLVQHLAPDHKSILTDLVRRYTSMQVFEVEDGMQVRPNCAYIIPPNRDMAFLNGSLQLLEPIAPRGQRMPIDYFFRSLALDQHEKAIGIVLSGTGSDGTMGIRAIKGEGGMVMVQSPASTDFDGMPRSALATGLVDYELPPDKMAAQIISYVHLALTKTIALAKPLPRAENILKKIFILIRAQTGHDFSNYKSSTTRRRIERRLAIHQIDSLESYLKYLQHSPEEVDALFRDMLIGVTSFFRDPEAFISLEENVIPKLCTSRSADSTIRIWAPGCSTGEEAYTLAILLSERQEIQRQSFMVQIFATDIDSSAIAAARAGLYPASIAADLTPERLAKYFSSVPGEDACRIHKKIRDMLIFSEQNVIKDPPFSRLDLICCRNLMIYLSIELQKKLIPLFHYALNPGGYLFLGTSETVGEYQNLFSLIDRKQKIYQRKDDLLESRSSGLSSILPSMMSPDRMMPQSFGAAVSTRKVPLRELTEQTLLQKTAPPAALVNSKGDILYLHGRTGLYLEPAPGESGVSNILKMARDGLRNDLTTSLHKAAVAKESVHVPVLRVRTNGDFTTARLTIHPVGSTTLYEADQNAAHPEQDLFLVILESIPEGLGKTTASFKPENGNEEDTDERISALKQELRAKEEYLQTANEELETSNEELKSSNEELQSVNEELQSINEELETSKEELQSVNEELATVNAELQAKVADLSRANNDINNLLAGTGIATVFVDCQLLVMKFTPAAAEVINLIQSDIGRPVGHIVPNLVGYDSLTADIQAVLDNLIPKEKELQTADGRWFTMHIQPYRTMENNIEGAVITFVDITSARKLREGLGEIENRLQSVTFHSPMLISEIDLNGQFLLVNPAFAALLELPQNQIVGKTINELLSPETVRVYKERIAVIVQSGAPVKGQDCLLTGQGEHRFHTIMFPLLNDAGRISSIGTIAQDIPVRTGIQTGPDT